MTFEHFPVDPTTFKTIPEELSHLKPKAQGKTNKRKGFVAGAVVLCFVLGSILATAGSATSIQPTTSQTSSLASGPSPMNQHTHPCRPRFTVKQGYDTYQEEYVCAHSVVWGTKQLCGGGYSPAVDSPQGEVAGPKGTGTSNGQDYYGVDVDEGCQPETALACGTIECKA